MAAKPTQKNMVIVVTVFLTCAFLAWNHHIARTYSCCWNCQRSDYTPLPHRRKDVYTPRNNSSNRSSFGRVRAEKDLVVVFFAVPKTGSRSLSNTFNILYTKIMNYKYVIVPMEDRATSKTLTSFLMNIDDRAFVRGHFPTVELPGTYAAISVVRDPLERFVSGFNFVKYGDGQIDTSRIKGGTEPEYDLSIDECVEQSVGYCSPEAISTFTISFFCGYDPRCKVANEWAYHRAITNVEERFLLVGVTEDLNTTMNLLEHLLPNMAKGLETLYFERQKEKRKLYVTGTKEQPSPHIREKLLRLMSWEYSFYNHVRLRFNRLKEMFSI